MPSVRSVFNRVDRSPTDGNIVRSEVKQMMESAGVGEGLLGSIKVKKATDEFMSHLDPQNDGAITLKDLVVQLKDLFSQLGQPGTSLTQKVLEWFDRTDASPKEGVVTFAELKSAIAAELHKHKHDQAEIKADIMAKVAMYLVDDSGSNRLTRAQAEELARDLEAVVGQPAPAEKLCSI